MNTITHRPTHFSIRVEDGFGRLLNGIGNYIKLRAQRHRDMRAIRELAILDDRDLRDMGIGRSDLIWASHLPLDDSPTAGLGKIARKQQQY